MAANTNPPRALLVDYGGVLTTNIWESFAAFCRGEGLDPDAVLKLFREGGEALALLRQLETGAISDEEFERRFAPLLGTTRHEGLIARMFSGVRPDEGMLGAVRAARAAGVRTGLITNSWGMGIYDRAPLDLFDATVISGEVGLHKPQPEIYRLACERLAVDPGEAVFVDDLRENVEGAEAVGMTGILHRDTQATLARLEELFGLGLRPSTPQRPAG
ncbi:MAG TPA: HAD family phosphatase [Solirubrobacterales bacterium]|jgi:epoxide hydrolase-like predicted phosphatase